MKLATQFRYGVKVVLDIVFLFERVTNADQAYFFYDRLISGEKGFCVLLD